MKIVLMMENSQVNKNVIIFKEFNVVVDEKGFLVYNVGMSDENDYYLIYIYFGIMVSILLNLKVVDFVVIGCGIGQGVLMLLNIYLGVVCGYCIDLVDVFLFVQINNGNVLLLLFVKGFGWGVELNVWFIFEKVFIGCNGEGYLLECKELQVCNVGIFNQVKVVVVKENYFDILCVIDLQLVKIVVFGLCFQQCFFENCQDKVIEDFVCQIVV